MNSSTSTERAANPILRAMREAIKRLGTSGMCVHAHRDPSAPSYSDAWFFEFTATAYKRAEGSTTIRDIPGRVSNGHTDATFEHTYEGRTEQRYGGEAFKPSRGFWYLAHNEFLASALALIPAHAEVRFYVYLDSHTNQTFVPARLHGDSIRLEATWKQGTKEVKREFLLDVTCGKHNTARFGVPSSF